MCTQGGPKIFGGHWGAVQGNGHRESRIVLMGKTMFAWQFTFHLRARRTVSTAMSLHTVQICRGSSCPCGPIPLFSGHKGPGYHASRDLACKAPLRLLGELQ